MATKHGLEQTPRNKCTERKGLFRLIYKLLVQALTNVMVAFTLLLEQDHAEEGCINGRTSLD